MKFPAAAALALALAAGLPVAAHAADIEVVNPFMRAALVAGGSGIAYMTINNHGAADKLVAVEGNISKLAELHTHVKDGDVYRMRKIDFLAVPEHGTAELKPGGDHVMFIGLNAPVKEGTSVPLTLKFEKAGAVTIQVPVLAAGAMAPGAAMPAGGHGSHHGH